jgi:hypothetical protein
LVVVGEQGIASVDPCVDNSEDGAAGLAGTVVGRNG